MPLPITFVFICFSKNDGAQISQAHVNNGKAWFKNICSNLKSYFLQVLGYVCLKGEHNIEFMAYAFLYILRGCLMVWSSTYYYILHSL